MRIKIVLKNTPTIKYFLLFIFLFNSVAFFAQEDLENILTTEINTPYISAEYTVFAIDSSQDLSIKEVEKQKFISPPNKIDRKFNVWHKIIINNERAIHYPLRLIFKACFNKPEAAYRRVSSKKIEHLTKLTGTEEEGIMTYHFTVRKKSKEVVYIKLTRDIGPEIHFGPEKAPSTQAFLSSYSSIFLIAAMMLFLYTGRLYFTSREPIYTIYLRYLLVILFLLGLIFIFETESIQAPFGLKKTSEELLKFCLFLVLMGILLFINRQLLQLNKKMSFAHNFSFILLLLGTSGYVLLSFINNWELFGRWLPSIREAYYQYNTDNPLFYLQLAGAGSVIANSMGIGYLNRYNLEKKQEEIRQKDIEIKQKDIEVTLGGLKKHFLGNVMNSIIYLVETNKKTEAAESLGSLDFFMRETLNTSGKKLISLNQEFSICEYYLKLANLRFGKKFNYNVSPSATRDESDKNILNHVFIPPFILQTLVENACEHGRSKNIHLKVTLTFEEGEKYYKCIIEDNGIGIAASKKNAEKKIKTRKRNSMGMGMVQKSLEQFNIKNNPLIIDKTIKEHGSTGVRAIVFIPKNQIFLT